MKCSFENAMLSLFFLEALLIQSNWVFGQQMDPQQTTETENQQKQKEQEIIGGESESVDPSKLEYAKGSVCGYCSYCKFCKLCEQDCPCETSRKKPNCKMCKYCKYCHLCSAVCDTVCTPGGILDRVSGAIVNSLPSFNKGEVDKDIDSVQAWIKAKKDEL